MWIFPVLLLFVQHSTGSILPMESPNEGSKISEEMQSQCSSFCIQHEKKCQESEKEFEEKNQQLTSLRAQLNVYQDKAGELEILLNYSNTIRESLWESYKTQSDLKEQVEQIVKLQSTLKESQLKEDQRQSFEDRINYLEYELKNRDLQIKEKEDQIQHVKDRTREHLTTIKNMVENGLEGNGREVLLRKLSFLLMFIDIKDPYLGY